MTTPSAPAGPAYTYNAACYRVVDGDTLIAGVDLGFYVTAAIRVRVRGVNAPEHNAPGGAEATAYLRATVGDPSRGLSPVPLLLRSFHDVRSFERWVCNIWIRSGDAWVDLAGAIIAAGHGVPMGDS